MKTKPATRWLALLLCAIALISFFSPAVIASEPEVEHEEDAVSPAPESPEPLPEEDTFTISPVVAALNDTAIGIMACWEDTDYNAIVRGEQSSGATVLSVPAGESIYLQRGGYVRYGDGYVTDYYSVWMGEGALAHEGDKNFASAAFCACPSMSGPNTGHYSGAAVQRLNANEDTPYTTLNVFKAVILTSPFGPLPEYHQDFWSVIDPSLAASDTMFATVHAILGYLYDPGSHGTPYRWDSVMQSKILGSGGLLEQITNWANANPNATSQAYVYRLKGSDNGLQDLVWMHAVPKFPLYLKKVSSNPALTDNNSKYSLGGAEYTVYSDANCTQKVGVLTTGDNGVSDILNVKEGSYYAKETKAPKGFELNSEVLGPVAVNASNTPGVFNATDHPTPTTGSGKLQKQSANPEITSGNSYYSLEGAEYTVYADDQLKKSVAVLKTDKNGNSQTVELDAGTYYVKETKAPAGFEEDETVHTMVVKANETAILKVQDVYVPGYASLKKVSSDAKITSGNENYSLANATYDVFSDKDCKTKVGTLTTKDDGTSETLTVPAGTYYARESKAPKGYKLNSEVLSVTVKPGETGVFQASDAPETGDVTLMKTSAVVNSGISLAGAEYTVYSDAACKTAVGKLTTDQSGKSNSITVPYGSYYAKESKAPAGYELNAAVIGPVTVNAENKTGTFKTEDVPIPTIGTTAAVDGAQVAKPAGSVKLTDTVHCKNLVVGTTYQLHATLMDKATGKAVQHDGKDITAEKEFKAAKSSEDIEVVFEIADASILEGKVTVVFEALSRDGKELVTHADLKDEGQTIWWPHIGTTATIDGTHSAKADGQIDLVDTVQYTSLQPGKEYTLAGTLMDKSTGEAILDADGNPITATQTFSPEKKDGSVEITFHIDDATILRGKTTVAFESVSYQGREVAIHADIADEDQTVYTPEIGTTATINGEHEVVKDHMLTLVDVVSYRGLEPGREYTVSGTLMDGKTGEIFKQGDQEIAASVIFIPETSEGTVELSFEFDSALLTEDTTLVAFEFVYDGERELAVHADLKDEGQTVAIRVPTMHTTAKVNGEKEAVVAKTVKITDTVTFTNLVVGKEYTLKGVLVDQKTGEPFTVNGEAVVSEVKFTPETKDGTIDVTFTFDGASIKTDTTLVVFEAMYRDEELVMTHADLKDQNQTVTIHTPDTPKTGDNSRIGMWLACAGVALGGVIACVIVYWKIRREETEEE